MAKIIRTEKFNTTSLEIQDNTYEQLGPTAWAVAYHRSLVDIKYASDIYQELLPTIETASQKVSEYLNGATKSGKITAQLEARFKLINKILGDYQPDTILEIAAGLSPRGLAMAEENPNLQYIEVDLPNMAAEKKKILTRLENKLGVMPENLLVLPGDTLDLQSLSTALGEAKQGKLAVMNEGLLRYLNFDQKAKVAKNVHALLQRFGGIWITPDITTRKAIVSTTKGAAYQRIKDLAGIDIDANSFKDEQHARDFFAQQGFNIETRNYSEIENDLVAPAKTGMTKEDVYETIAALTPIFVMRLKTRK